MPLYEIKRLARSHSKTIGFVPAPSGAEALRNWGMHGCTREDWLQAEQVFDFAVDDDDVTETMR